MMSMAKKRQKTTHKEGYTLAEMRNMTRRLIDESVERLRKQIRADQKKKQVSRVRNIRHGVTV